MQWDKEIEIEWDAPELFEVLGDEYSKEFAIAELSPKETNRNVFSSAFGRGQKNYVKRIEALGFVGKEKVLDAGCGMGQWTYILSQYNKAVVGVDCSEHRIKIAKYLNRQRENVVFSQEFLEKLSFDSQFFDAIFCYGVFMFTDMQKTLEVFKRVLKPDGIIFLNFNNIGHYVHRIFHYSFEVKDEKLVEQYSQMIANYYKGHYRSSLMTLEKISEFLQALNMEIIYKGYDGECAKLPFYREEFLNFPYVTEILVKNR
ncbi:class I SAM-dependent methyltransferase [Helicobacter mesocricetorum]|uniref:class I SAM-dependent methyltransferase n=1 Tax=Helicobacter mesocricetorum TaxID=87012 RepID=UPI000CF19374|nr:class I SAM-dependent methyltransferase [Helicobacter mesocricetorum]